MTKADSDPLQTSSRDPSLLQKARAYLLVGGLAAVVDIGLFHLMAPDPQQVLAAAAASFVVAAIVNYTLSSVWVFRRNWRSLRRAVLFFLAASVGLCINAGVTWWLAGLLPIVPTLAKVGGTAVAVAANFALNTFVVFRAVDPVPDSRSPART